MVRLLLLAAAIDLLIPPLHAAAILIPRAQEIVPDAIPALPGSDGFAIGLGLVALGLAAIAFALRRSRAAHRGR